MTTTTDLSIPTVRMRLGLIIPSSNRLTEPQMRRYAPAGVEVHVTRLRMTGASHVPLAELMPRVTEAVAALDDARCDVIVFHCTAGSMEAGLAGERQILETMRRATATDRPIVATTASAALAALEALGARRIVLASPYARATHEHELAFLAEAGFEVVRERALDLDGSDEYVTVPPTTWLAIGEQEMDGSDADALFLSCTNIHSLPVIEPLEARLGRPVVTSNQAVLWYALRQCGLPDQPPALGRLASLGLPQPAPA